MRVHEVRALRAFFYLELAKRYGDIPLLTRTYQIDEINSVEKTPFDKVIDFIVDECDKAAPELPVSYKDFYNETGRLHEEWPCPSRHALYCTQPANYTILLTTLTNGRKRPKLLMTLLKRDGTLYPILMWILCMT